MHLQTAKMFLPPISFLLKYDNKILNRTFYRATRPACCYLAEHMHSRTLVLLLLSQFTVHLIFQHILYAYLYFISKLS